MIQPSLYLVHNIPLTFLKCCCLSLPAEKPSKIRYPYKFWVIKAKIFAKIFSGSDYLIKKATSGPVRNTWQVGNLNIEEPIKFQFWGTSGSEKMEILNLFLC